MRAALAAAVVAGLLFSATSTFLLVNALTMPSGFLDEAERAPAPVVLSVGSKIIALNSPAVEHTDEAGVKPTTDR